MILRIEKASYMTYYKPVFNTILFSYSGAVCIFKSVNIDIVKNNSDSALVVILFTECTYGCIRRAGPHIIGFIREMFCQK